MIINESKRTIVMLCDELLLLTLWLQVLGISIPYALNIWKNNYEPPLPFISHAVGSPPENGIFTFLMVPGSFLGIVLCCIIYKIPCIQTKGIMETLHNASFWCGVTYFLSWILISASPFSFTDLPNKYEWVFCVLFEHMIGAMLMLGSCVMFIVLQGIFSWSIHDSEMHRWKIAIFVVPVALIGILSLISLAVEEFCTVENSMKYDVYHLPSKLSSKYILTSACEWSLIVSMWLTLMTFYKEMRLRKFFITVLVKKYSLVNHYTKKKQED